MDKIKILREYLKKICFFINSFGFLHKVFLEFLSEYVFIILYLISIICNDLLVSSLVICRTQHHQRLVIYF